MHPLALFFLLFLGASFVHGQVRNVTIDDGTGDELSGVIPVYGGMPPWRARKPGDTCSACFLQPAGDQMVGATWHDATTSRTEQPAEISFTFKGANLFVFCTLAGLHKDTWTQTHLTLIVDGVSSGTFDWIPDASSPDYQYQYPVLAAKGLENRDHAVKVLSHSTVVDGQAVGSLILFDYVLYNADVTQTSDGEAAASMEPSSSTTPLHHKSSDSKLVLSLGIVCGVVGLVLLVGSLVFFLRFRRRRRQTQVQAIHRPTLPPLPQSIAPSGEVRPLPGSEVFAQPLNLGSPVVTSMSDHKLNLRAGLLGEKHTGIVRDDEAPPIYS